MYRQKWEFVNSTQKKKNFKILIFRQTLENYISVNSINEQYTYQIQNKKIYVHCSCKI